MWKLMITLIRPELKPNVESSSRSGFADSDALMHSRASGSAYAHTVQEPSDWS